MLIKEGIAKTEEKRITIGLILSTDFFKKIYPILKLDYFTNSYLKTISSWCITFYDSYQKAPFNHIHDIFQDEYNANRIKETEAELIDTLLKSLAETYSEDDINVDFWVEMATDYFRSREMEILINNISILKEKGDLEEGEKLIADYYRVPYPIEENETLINPADLETQERIYKKRDEEEANFFQIPGDLGKYLGNWKRGDVVGFFGPAKRGKCIHGDSLIYLSDGTVKTIKEVVEKRISNILCKDDKDKIIQGKVDNWIFCGLKQEYIIKTKGGRFLRTSKDHKFYTPYGWKKLSELHKNDLVATGKNINLRNNSSIPIYELKIMAYLIADGYIKPKYSIEFTKHDTEIMNDFISCVTKFNDSVHFNSKTSVNVHMGNINKLLTKHNLKGKLAGTKFIPDYILKASDSDLSFFLKILFTCDGSIWKDNNCVSIGYSSKSYLLINQVLFCLNRFGVYGKLFKKVVKKQTYYEILILSNAGILTFMNKIGFAFHKQKKAITLCKNLKPIRDYVDVIPNKYVKEVGDTKGCKGNETFRVAYKQNKNISRYTFELVAGSNHLALNNDLLWDKIVSIEKNKIVPMYDLTIKKYHNYLVNGFIVHNSRTLLSMYKYGILSKKKTLFFSIEMTDTEVLPLTNQVFFPMVDDEPGKYRFPVFDCEYNQTGICSKRISNTTVEYEKPSDDEKQEKGAKTLRKPIYDPGHTVCTKCRNHPDFEIRKKFKLATFWEEIYRDTNDIFTVREQMKRFQKMWHKYGRLSVHKKYTLTYDKLMRDIDILWQRQEWFPDILIIDYVDILGINSKFDDFRLVDEQWKLLAKLAGETNTLVITATQGNLAAHKTDQLDSTHQSGFYGKSRHVNMMVGLNQNSVEKDLGIMKYGITEARSIPFIPGQNCITLSNFETGQSYIDSYYAYKKGNRF